jgi:hypothetical protein
MTISEHSSWLRLGPPVRQLTSLSPSPVFDPLTGETLFLSDLPAMLLEAIDSSPRSVEELLSVLVGPVDLVDSKLDVVFAAIQHLSDAGLIERVSQQARNS